MGKAFVSVFDSEMKILGFKRSNSIYHKELSDKILGMLSYKEYGNGHELTIQFDLIPFCKGYKFIRFMDGSFFLSDIIKDFDPLVVDKREKSDAFHRLLDICKDSVFPLFSLVTDYKSYLEYYKTVSGYEEVIANKTYPYPYIYSKMIPIANVLLALREYNQVLLVLEASVKISEIAVDSQSKSFKIDPKYTPAYPGYLERIKQYNQMKSLIALSDTPAIESIIKKNERLSQESYYQVFGYE